MLSNNILVLWLQVVITVGVAVAAYGEIHFILFGVLLQLFSVATESIRLTLVQILLQVVLQHFTSDMPEFLQAGFWAHSIMCAR